jgi:transposase
MIVIGADTHKSTHALAAVDAGTGRVHDGRQITAREEGHQEALRWARAIDEDRVWALEDCRHVSRHLEQTLVAAGERVVRVPPMMMGASRRGERAPGKSDQIDARTIARAVLREGVERFPTAYLDEQAMDIRLLSDHRGNLVAERGKAQNRLRWHLVQLDPDLESTLRPGPSIATFP